MNIGILFPGQGAQAVGMGAALCERSSIARDLFTEASQILDFDLLELCQTGPAEQLNRTEFCQPALFVHSFAALKQLEADRPELWDSVAAVAGLSLGEYTAVAAAGGVTFADAVRLVHIRGRAMQAAADAVSSSMSSIIGLDQDKISDACQAASDPQHFAQVANLLCPGNIAISGHTAAIERAEELCMAAGAMKAIRLQVAGAFHTPLMQPAVEQLTAALANVEFKQTRVPVYSNVDAGPHTTPDEFRSLLARQVVNPVLWEASLRAMLAAGIEQFIEIGAGRILAGTLKRINRKTPCENLGE
ncbi:ACP S-malonyltransferase [Aureliella helgolandensis]|uniref:Malonyl CoA-acyl carrier protein transacylase n=1 Tax=Aureliella helgolandensis TaxID=2527968 RepID=A0A518GG05_9BACT|nr:ACP S-malonyltransferase [Aureliella helgolandensis]QDV27523.1 Malonyl CoA-acyl carrier protein transacylase [Aureliella helgolandensis]